MGNEMRVRILQLADTPENAGLFFRGYNSVEKNGISITGDRYEVMYDCQRPESHNMEAIYVEFNVNNPADFKGHSLSVSDVVVADYEDGTQKCYYVDIVGFKELPAFNPGLAYKPTSR